MTIVAIDPGLSAALFFLDPDVLRAAKRSISRCIC